jgi:hypothetical protein
MKKSLLLFFITCAIAKTFAQQQFQLLSPDKTIKAIIQTSNQLSYSVFIDDKKTINGSIIDMQLSNGNALSKDLKIESTKTKSINGTIVAQIPLSRRNIPMFTMNLL